MRCALHVVQIAGADALIRCQGLTQEQLEACFTLDPAESPIQVVSWGRLGDAWPYFRPNFTNMEEARQQAGAQEVGGAVPGAPDSMP